MPVSPRLLLSPTAATWCGLLLAVSTVALAQGKGIYTCVDNKGRRITSDRPITECLDREQRELTSSGTVKRVLPPSYTAEERARIDTQKKAEEALLARIAEEKRQDRALLIRYPNKPVHDKARADALAQIDEVISAVNKRAQTLIDQRKDINAELEFYQDDVSKAPLWLRRKLEDNEQQVAVQQRFVVEQTQEKERVNARFDEELAKLRLLWGQR